VEIRKEETMAKCNKCNTQDNIVHSGVDALLLGVLDQIEQVCYACANQREGDADTNNGDTNGSI